MTTFQISEFKQADFIAKMDKFTRKANKLNLSFGYTLESTSEEHYTLENNSKVYYTVFNYSVYGESPTINGYSFLAKIEKIDSVNMIHSHNNTFDFSVYRMADLVCEHCKVNRERNFYFLIQNEETKEVKMLGHNCLANYINLPDAESIAQFYSDFIVSSESMSQDETSEESIKNSAIYTIKINEFLALANIIVKESGYVSSKNQDERNPSTKTLTVNEFFYNGNDKVKLTEEDTKHAESIITAVKDNLEKKSNLTEYEFNILTLINNGNMKIEHAGYIVSIIPLYNRIIVTAEENIASDKVNSEFIGAIGDKINNVSAIVTFYNQYTTQYGYTHLYKLNSNNNVIVYFSSKCLDIEVNQSVIILSATIKNHDIYNNTKQTIITRGKIK